jgi:dipeptidyl aminopeptidase/acylaminoacyl peptidase
VLIVAAVLMACAAAVLAVSEKAEAAFPGKNGKIAFTSLRDGRTGSEDIYTMNARGTAVEPLINDPQDDHEPAWSPYGTKIAFQSNRDGNYEIYTIKPNGTGLDRLTNDPKEDSEPAWSPDGNRIAFVSDRDGNPSAIKASQDPRSNYEIYTMNPNGQALDRLTNNPVGDFNPDWQPLWPPDNTRAVKVISTSPKANATGVAPAANIRATFSKDMKPKIINNTTFKLFKKKGSTTKKIAAAVGYSAATDKATLNPRKRLQKGATYKAVVTKGAKDVAGKSLDQNTTKAGLQQKVWSFKVIR